jgi:hypothetical protein
MLSYSSALARIAACSATHHPSLSRHPTPRLFFVLILPMAGSVCFRRQRLRGRRCRAPWRRTPRSTTRIFERLPPCSLDLSEGAQEANGQHLSARCAGEMLAQSVRGFEVNAGTINHFKVNASTLNHFKVNASTLNHFSFLPRAMNVGPEPSCAVGNLVRVWCDGDDRLTKQKTKTKKTKQDDSHQQWFYMQAYCRPSCKGAAHADTLLTA